MNAIDEFYRAFAGAFLVLFLAAVARLTRPLHVPALVKGRNPWGRKFDEASALKQNQFVVRMLLGFAVVFVVYGVGALVVGLVQSLT